ncbi:MAG: transporter substrate-binding protein [Xanthobacteraceae bacterium]|jgi:trehalose/maltose transport system substrate-binding protein|nr:transporter substrate-binding protein [Xanthobacteraceae bacterium]
MKATVLALLVSVAAGIAVSEARAADLAIACSALGKERELCQEGIDEWAKRTGNTVHIVSAPNSATERLALYQQLLAARALDIDVFQIDVVWPGILARDLVDLTEIAGPRADDHLPAMVKSATVDGRFVAMPWFADVGLLYYRKDLLEAAGRPVPRSLAELAETAQLVQERQRAAGDPGFWGYVWQGRAYEGLTVNALEWIASSGGGTIIDDAGAVTINNPRAAGALSLAAGLVGTISPRGVLNYTEEEARGVFQSGHALFMRNWPYAWALGESPDSTVKGRIGFAPLPAGEPTETSHAVLGGQLLAVSAYSANRELAIDLVMYLTGREEQKRRALAGSVNPTIPALFDDADIRRDAPFIAQLRPIFEGAVARPSAVTRSSYNKVSARFFDAVHQVLSGSLGAGPALERLAQALRREGTRRGWAKGSAEGSAK